MVENAFVVQKTAPSSMPTKQKFLRRIGKTVAIVGISAWLFTAPLKEGISQVRFDSTAQKKEVPQLVETGKEASQSDSTGALLAGLLAGSLATWAIMRISQKRKERWDYGVYRNARWNEYEPHVRNVWYLKDVPNAASLDFHRLSKYLTKDELKELEEHAWWFKDKRKQIKKMRSLFMKENGFKPGFEAYCNVVKVLTCKEGREIFAKSIRTFGARDETAEKYLKNVRGFKILLEIQELLPDFQPRKMRNLAELTFYVLYTFAVSYYRGSGIDPEHWVETGEFKDKKTG